MCIEVVIERGVLETEGVGGYFVCLHARAPGLFSCASATHVVFLFDSFKD